MRIETVKIKSILPIGTHRVLNLTVSKNANFILSNGILTHNSSVSQAALRNITEATYASTRYILTCNYPEKIIAPLHSRFKEIVFSKLDEKAVIRKVASILKNENIEIPKDQASKLGQLIKKFYPDIRKIINYLQSFSNSGKLNIIFEDIVSIDIFEQIYNNIKLKKFSEIRTILRNNKIDYIGVIRKFFEEIINSESMYFKEMTESKRAECVLLCSEYIFKSNFIIDQEINFAAFCIDLSRSIA